MDRRNDLFQTSVGEPGILTWSEVKERLSGRSEKGLLKLLGECYSISPDVKVKLSLAVSEGREEASNIISDLHKRLYKEFWTKEENGAFIIPDLNKARRIVTVAKRSTDDPVLLLNLMLDHFEHGVGFTGEHGDMWDAYYGSIESMFQKTCDYIVAHRSEIDLDIALKRIDENIKKTDMMGWGFHDNLVEIREELGSKLGR